MKITAGGKTGLRQNAEKMVANGNLASQGSLSNEQMWEALHELRVHQVELEIQNEELRRTQHELEISHAQYIELYDHAPLGYLTLDEYGRMERVNITAANLLGTTRESLLNDPFTLYIVPEDQDAYYLYGKKFFKPGEQDSLEIRLLRADGTRFWVHIHANLDDNGGQRISLANIGKRKQLEEDLQKKETLYNSILQTALEGFWIVDLAGHILDVNNAYCRIIGYSREELLGMSIKDLEVLEDEGAIERTVRRIVETGNHRFESKHRCKDGSIVDLEISANYLPREAKLFTFLRDITEQNLNKAALLSASAYNRSLIEASLDPLVTISADGKITDVNEASIKVTGVPREQMIGTDFSGYFTDPEKANEGYRRVFSEGSVHDYPLVIKSVSGAISDVLYNATLYHDAKGEVKGVFAAARDVTELNRAHDALKRANVELEKRVVERTVSLEQAHEQMKRISFELVWAEQRERERIAGELHDQVGQSLLLAKMKLDELAGNIASLPLSSSAEAVAALLQNSIHEIRSLTFRMRPPLLDTAGLETSLKWLCSSISDDYKLSVDFTVEGAITPLSSELRYSVYQVVRELLLNVAKHAETDRACLMVKFAADSLKINVTDNGVGFKPEAAQPKQHRSGGYGLYNVQQRIERLDGTLAIESTPGKGTVVILMVPLA